MKYQAVCKLHPAFAAPERDEYAAALEDLTAHQQADHWIGVVTLEDEPEPESPADDTRQA